MTPESQTNRGVVGDDALSLRRRLEARPTFLDTAGPLALGCQRQRTFRTRDLPVREVPVAAQSCKRPGRRQCLEIAAIQCGPPPEILNALELPFSTCGL